MEKTKKNGWCKNPDEAFDNNCSSLASEDWCKDNSVCPLQREDQRVYISVSRTTTLKNLELSDCVVLISDDKKSFEVIKHRYLPIIGPGYKYHISELKNILLGAE